MMEWILGLMALTLITADGPTTCRDADYTAPNGAQINAVASPDGNGCLMIIATGAYAPKPAMTQSPARTPAPTRTPTPTRAWVPTPTSTPTPAPINPHIPPAVQATNTAFEAAVDRCLELDSFQTAWGATYTRADWDAGHWRMWCIDFYPK